MFCRAITLTFSVTPYCIICARKKVQFTCLITALDIYVANNREYAFKVHIEFGQYFTKAALNKHAHKSEYKSQVLVPLDCTFCQLVAGVEIGTFELVLCL